MEQMELNLDHYLTHETDEFNVSEEFTTVHIDEGEPIELGDVTFILETEPSAS